MNRTATATTTRSGTEGADDVATDLLRQLDGAPARLVCAWASTTQPLPPLLRGLQARFPEAAVVGASTAGEFTGAGDVAGHVVVFAVAGDFVVTCGFGDGLKAQPEKALQQALQSQPTAVPTHPHRAALLLFDGLAGVGEEVTLTASLLLGEDVKVAGAAAGDDWKVKETVVGTGARAAADAVVVCLIHSKKPLGLGVRHGHEPFSEVVRVTKSKDNLVLELDGQPAFERYAAVTVDDATRSGLGDPRALTEASALLRYFARYSPAVRAGSEWRNRTALVKNGDGSLGFTCGIAEGTELTILKSDADRQLASARRAAEDAKADVGGAVAGALVFDCVCRKVLLGDGFADAARAIAAVVDAPVAGFESYGEVALRAGDFSGFHNTTTVVLAFPKE